MNENHEIKPLLKWAGGKEKELPIIQKKLPQKINRFVEPFVGGGSVFLNLGRDEIFINDKSKELINLYRLVKNQDEEFFYYLREMWNSWKSISDFADSKKDVLRNLYFGRISVENFISENVEIIESNFNKKLNIKKIELVFEFEKNLKSKIDRTKKIADKKGQISDEDIFNNMETALKSSYYMCLRNLYNNPDKINNEQFFEAIFYFIREYCYASMFRYNSEGKFNVPYGGISYNRKDFTSKIEYLQSEKLHEKLKDVHIFNLDFEEFLNSLDLQKNDFIFLDPPYDSDFSTYAKISFGKEEQIRLSNFLKTTKAQFMLVIKKTDFIHELYKEFHISSFKKKYLVSFKNRNDRNTTHLIITNYKQFEAENV